MNANSEDQVPQSGMGEVTHSDLAEAQSERRIRRTAAAAAAIFTVGYGAIVQTWMAPVSVLLGAGLAWINFGWMAAGVTAIVIPANPKKINKLVFRFLFRLVLILGILYVMIRVSLVAALGVLAGLSIFVVAMMVEAVLLLLTRK